MLAYGLEPLCWAFFGLAVGSFVNVVAHRLPRSRSLFYPASHCTRCRRLIAYRDNVPVLSYLLLGGKCRFCRKPISCRYPAVEFVGGALSLALWWRYRGDSLWIFCAASAAAALVAVALIDWDTFLIPNELSLGLAFAGLAAAPLNPVFAGGALWGLAPAALGALSGLALSWAIAAFGEHLFKKEAMGGGDVKLMAAVGAWSGALGAFDCMVVASFLGAGYGLVLIGRGKLSRRDPIPFGPFLSAAALFNLFYILPFGFPFHQ